MNVPHDSPYLPADWHILEPIDFEYKMYRLTAYLNKVHRLIEYGEFFPHYNELLFHGRMVELLSQNKTYRAAVGVPERLITLDVEDSIKTLNEILKLEKKGAEFKKIIDWALVEIKKEMNYAITKMDSYRELFHISIDGIGTAGCVVLYMPNLEFIEVASFNRSIMHIDNEKYKATIFMEFENISFDEEIQSMYDWKERKMEEIGISEGMLITVVLDQYISEAQRRYLTKKYVKDLLDENSYKI